MRARARARAREATKMWYPGGHYFGVGQMSSSWGRSNRGSIDRPILGVLFLDRFGPRQTPSPLHRYLTGFRGTYIWKFRTCARAHARARTRAREMTTFGGTSNGIILGSVE